MLTFDLIFLLISPCIQPTNNTIIELHCWWLKLNTMLLNCIPVDDPEQRPHTLILCRASSVGKWGQRLLQEAVCVCCVCVWPENPLSGHRGPLISLHCAGGYSWGYLQAIPTAGEQLKGICLMTVECKRLLCLGLFSTLFSFLKIFFWCGLLFIF